MKLTEEYILTELKKFATTHKDYGLIITERNAERFAEDVVKNCSIPAVVGRSEQLKAEVFTLANKLAVSGEGDAAVAMHRIHNSL